MKIVDLDTMCVIKWRLTDICNYHCSYCIRRDFIQSESNLIYDFATCLDAADDVIRIAEELYTINKKKVKIDLIGGEISLFKDLGILLNKLYESYPIAKINITTNLSKPAEYFLKLNEIATSHNKVLSMTASFHYEYADLDTFIEKAKVLNEALGNNFKCETVITNGNEQVEDFIKKCEEINCHYMCEEDLLDTSKRGEKIRNYKVGDRYLVIFDDGTEKTYPTRNEVLKQFGKYGVAINTKGMRCSRDNDYVYIEKNMAIPCHNMIPIKNYRVSECPQDCRIGECTLCGHMSIYPKESELDKIN